MASKSKKKRRRSRFPWTPFWLVAFLSVTAAGLALSDITQPRIIKIVSAQEYDRQRLTEIAETLKGRPALRISPAAIESAVEENNHVAKSRFRANIFGRATLEVEYRTPVAMVEGEGDLALGEDGVIFSYPGAERPSLTVERNEQLFGPILTIGDPSRLRALADLAKNFQLAAPKLTGNLAIDSRGGLCLRAGGSSEVRFGGADRLPQKVRVLVSALSADPDLLETHSVNLVDPERPMREKAN